MARSCSCNDFTRSQLLRRGAAVAGKGLPNIERGMPLPAGTGIDRRTFLLRSAGAALSVYGVSMLSPRQFEEGIAQAQAAAGPNQPVLVSIFMEGGWDALSVLAPVKEARYKELRPGLGLAEGCRQGLHRGRKPDVASGRYGPGRTPRRRQGHGLPGDRLRAGGREPLHEPPLLGGRPARRQSAHRLDGALPRRRRRSRQPAAGPVAGLLAGAGASPRRRCPWRRCPHRPTTRCGPTGWANRSRGPRSRPSAHWARSPRRRPPSPRRGTPPTTRASCSTAWRASSSPRKNPATNRRSPIPRATSPNGSPRSRRCSTPECRSNARR